MTGRAKQRRTKQRGGTLDLQKALAKTGIEFHWPGYQYMGPGTHLRETTEAWRSRHQQIGPN